jgi:hypothetical protein
LRNGVNVALPVTDNLIDPLRLAFMKAAAAPLGYRGKAARHGAMFTVAKGSQVTELTLPAGSLAGDCNLSRGLEWMTASDGSEEVVSLQAAVASLRKRHSLRCSKDNAL